MVEYLKNKKILLTGASGGFGTEFIHQLLDKGAQLILSDMDEAALISKNTSASGMPGKIAGVIGADLSTPEGCETLYLKTREKAGDVDIIIHNAGILTYGFYHEAPIDRLYRLMQINMLSPMHLTSLFLQDMTRRGAGHLVFISSVAGFIPTSFETAYSVSKFALRGFGMALNGELAKTGISVTNVYPFWANTNILNSPSYGGKQAKKVPSFLTDTPQKVVRAAIRGMEKQKLHVYPGLFAKVGWWASKIWPLTGQQPVSETAG